MKTRHSLLFALLPLLLIAAVQDEKPKGGGKGGAGQGGQVEPAVVPPYLLLIARNFLSHPLGYLPAEGPESVGVRGAVGGSSGPLRARNARFGRMSQRFSREAGRFRGPAAEKSNRQGMRLGSRSISLLKSSGRFRIVLREAPQFTPATDHSASGNGSGASRTKRQQAGGGIFRQGDSTRMIANSRKWRRGLPRSLPPHDP